MKHIESSSAQYVALYRNGILSVVSSYRRNDIWNAICLIFRSKICEIKRVCAKLRIEVHEIMKFKRVHDIFRLDVSYFSSSCTSFSRPAFYFGRFFARKLWLLCHGIVVENRCLHFFNSISSKQSYHQWRLPSLKISHFQLFYLYTSSSFLFSLHLHVFPTPLCLTSASFDFQSNFWNIMLFKFFTWVPRIRDYLSGVCLCVNRNCWCSHTARGRTNIFDWEMYGAISRVVVREVSGWVERPLGAEDRAGCMHSSKHDTAYQMDERGIKY